MKVTFMLNISIKKSTMDPILTFDTIIASKEDGKYKRKTAVLKIQKELYVAYGQYEKAFNNDQFEKLSSSTLFQNNKAALISMYSYDDSELQKYKKEIMSNNNFQDEDCPICQIDTISSFDHFLPKEDFPEYSINIHNLIPSCSICNNLKRKSSFVNNKRFFINIYLDKIPSDKRFVYLKYDNNNFPIFYIDNLDNMDSDLYERLNNTFTKLNILKRYNNKMYKEIQKLNYIFNKMKFLPKTRIQKIIKKRLNENKLYYGDTHWKTLLYKELINYENLLDFIIHKKEIILE